MSYKKLTSIILYVVAAISLVVMLFFYVAPKSVDDVDALDAKYDALVSGNAMAVQLDAPVELEADTTVIDSASVEGEAMEADTAAAEVDSAAVIAATEVIEPVEEVAGEVDLKDHFTGWERMVLKRTDYALGWAYVLLIIAAIAAIVFPMINIATDVKALIRLAAILGGAALVVLLSYFVLASGETIDIIGYTKSDNSNPTILKWVGTSLFATYFLFGVAILSILYSEVVKLFK